MSGEKKKRGKCGKGVDIFSVLGYNRSREALANSQRPPTVEITALFALEELREGGYFFLFLRYVRIEQVAEMILQIMPITCANRFIRLNRFTMCTTSLRLLYGERTSRNVFCSLRRVRMSTFGGS